MTEEDCELWHKQVEEKNKQTKRLNDFIDEQRTTIARQIVELTEKDKQIKELQEKLYSDSRNTFAELLEERRLKVKRARKNKDYEFALFVNLLPDTYEVVKL